MTVYIDSSAIYAFMDSSDADHEQAKATWINLVESNEDIACTNYVLLETSALMQHRLGTEAARVLQADVFPVLSIARIDEAAHREAVSAMLIAGRKDLSLVDCSSFVT